MFPHSTADAEARHFSLPLGMLAVLRIPAPKTQKLSQSSIRYAKSELGARGRDAADQK